MSPSGIANPVLGLLNVDQSEVRHVEQHRHLPWRLNKPWVLAGMEITQFRPAGWKLPRGQLGR